MQMVLVETDVKSLQRWDRDNRIDLEVHKAVFSEAEWRDQSRLARFKNPVSGGIIGIKMWAQTCDVLLQDKSLLERIEVIFCMHLSLVFKTTSLASARALHVPKLS
jgi:hypothetical protein